MILGLELLPQEVLLRILAFTQLPDLLQISRTCHTIRELACDPQLHHQRLHDAAVTLSIALARRPVKASISPPNAWICLSKTNVLSRQINRSLVRIRLSHSLEHRPSPAFLVARAILPSSCATYSSPVSPVLIQSQQAVQKQQLRDGLDRKLEHRPDVSSLVSLNIMPEECARRSISPGIIVTRRKVIRESLKDGLRAWVESRGIQAQKRKADELDATERSTVKNLARKFNPKKLSHDVRDGGNIMSLEKKRAQARWGREAELARRREQRVANGTGACAHPTRAHVLGLKRFWEGVIRTAAG